QLLRVLRALAAARPRAIVCEVAHVAHVDGAVVLVSAAERVAQQVAATRAVVVAEAVIAQPAVPVLDAIDSAPLLDGQLPALASHARSPPRRAARATRPAPAASARCSSRRAPRARTPR